MTEPIFVDSNILLYAIDKADPSKQKAARNWQNVLWKCRLGRLSFQVLSEFYVNAVRIRSNASEEAREEIRDLLAWEPVAIDAALLELGWKIQDRYRISFWDSLIVAASKTASCRYLLTEDLQAGQDFDGVKVLNPFLTDPGMLV